MRTRSHSVSVAPVVRAATEESDKSDEDDEGDEGDDEFDRLYINLGDNEWMLRSDHEEHMEDDEVDEEGFGDDFGDSDVIG